MVTEPVDGRHIEGLITAADIATAEHERAEAIRALASLGVVRVEVATGTRFDPARHRAVAVAPAPTPDRVRTIAEMVRPGWRSNARMVRYVEVKVFVRPTTDPFAVGVEL